jgi:hypothetical protein
MKIQFIIESELDLTQDYNDVLQQINLIGAAVDAMSKRMAPEEPKVTIGGFDGTVSTNTSTTL